MPTTALTFDESGLPELDAPGGSQQMLYRIETFPAGTVFSTWLRLRRATDLEAAFFKDILKAFTADGRLGGRVGTGHGQVRVNLKGTPVSPPAKTDWRAITLEHRAQILTALETLA